jgi:acyl-CoA dehydrogenase
MNAILALLAVSAAFAVLIICIAPLRRRCITLFVFRLFKKLMPPLSETEKAAMLAGKMGEETSLLYKPKWEKIFPNSKFGSITEEEKNYLNGPVEKLCALVDDYAISQTRVIPKEVWGYMKEIRIFAMNIRKEYGGLELSKTAQAKVFVKLASRSFDMAVVAMVPNSLGPAELLHHKGTEAQKKRWMPGLADGNEIPAFGLTEPSAGSDAGGMESSGIVYTGSDGKPWMRLNWSKRYITLGPVATLLGLAFKLYDPEHILGEKENVGITVALIPINADTKAAGVSIGRFHDPLGGTFPNGPNSGKNVCFPIDDYVIGGREQAGKGWEMLMECLSTGRFVSLPSVSVGGAKFTCATVGAYTRIRKQFNTSIGNFGGIEEQLGKMVGMTYLMESMLYAGTALVDNGGKSPVLSAIAKYHSTQKLEEIIIRGMEILGGKGIILGPKNFLAGIHRKLKIATTVEGANILTRSMIIFGQGFIRCHPWLLKEMYTLDIADKKEALREFDRALMGHAGYAVKTFFRAWLHGLGGWRFSHAPQRKKQVHFNYRNKERDLLEEKNICSYYQKMNRMAGALALVSEATLVVLGGRLKTEERISARLGDVLSYLYQGGALLKRYKDIAVWGEERPLMEWGLQYSLFEMQNALVGVLQNFPLPFVGRLLMGIIFPFGKPYAEPSDALEKELAHIVMGTRARRHAVIGGIYFPPAGNVDENVSLLETALLHVEYVEPFERKLASAKKAKTIANANDFASAVREGIITEQQKEALEEAARLREKVIAVDDFETLG